MSLSEEEKAFHSLPDTSEHSLDPIYNLAIDKENMKDLGMIAEDGITQDLTRKNITSDGKSADYYKLPPDATEIQDLISFKNMNAQVGEMFRALYRFGQCSHSDEVREIKKVIFYGEAELARLKKYGNK